MKIHAIKDALRDRFGLTTCPLCKTGSFEVRPRAVTIIDKLYGKQAAQPGPGKTGESSLSGQDLVYTSCSSCGYVLLFDPQKLSVNISEAAGVSPCVRARKNAGVDHGPQAQQPAGGRDLSSCGSTEGVVLRLIQQ